jgi:hypothetical protein
MTTTVIHIRNAPPGWEQDPRYVYIGRTCYGQADNGWGNPFPLADPNDPDARDQVLDMYQLYWFHPNQAPLRQRARRELVGKILVCWCHPRACHGDILARYVNTPVSTEPA